MADKSERLTVLSDAEQFALYGLPDFDDRQRLTYLSLSGGRVGLMQMNSNDTADLGLMQVNTIWIQPLARYAHMAPIAVFDRLKNDSCFNIAAAAAIMGYYLAQAHGNLMVAIGYYHSHSPKLSSEYQQKVIAAAVAMFARREEMRPGATRRADR